MAVDPLTIEICEEACKINVIDLFTIEIDDQTCKCCEKSGLK